MFGTEKSKEITNNNTGKQNRVETIIGNGTIIEGDIYTKGSLRVEGEIAGNLKADGDLVVGENGIVKTKIEAQNIIIAGKINGEVIAHKKLELKPTSVVQGDIISEILQIEAGAKFTGNSKNINQEKTDKLKSTRKENKNGNDTKEN